jgi:hypothetical protein
MTNPIQAATAVTQGVAAAALNAQQLGQGVQRRLRIGVGIEPAAAPGADAAPVADQQRPAEQVGPDLEAVEPPFVLIRADTHQ